jgi:hypothetical protein
MLDVLGKDCFEVAAAEGERPVEALALDGADDAVADGVGPGRSGGGGDDACAIGGETESKEALNLVSPSRTRNLIAFAWSTSGVDMEEVAGHRAFRLGGRGTAFRGVAHLAVVWSGGRSRTRGRYSTSWIRSSKVLLAVMSSATSG